MTPLLARRLESVAVKDLTRKMVFIAGPRQCGKTTLAKKIATAIRGSYSYYCWDIDEDRKKILQGKLDSPSRLWILDELHKYRHWRNWLKGKFDQHHPDHSFLVTGSAKLHAYSRGGDSLQGRYYLHRLHPFTLAEILQTKVLSTEETVRCEQKVKQGAMEALQNLLLYGGFPEPFLSSSQKEAGRWRLAYGSRLVRDEIRSLEQIQDLDKMELLLDRLPETVGSVLSINSLREDLEVAFETVRHWIQIFEKLYAVFRVPPFGAPRIKAVKKEQKLYFWDWGKVENAGSRFENLLAVHLLRFVHWQQDVEGEKWELRYFRDALGREVDFLLLRGGRPWCAMEVKSREQDIDSNLKYFLERVRCPYAFHIHLEGKGDWKPEAINGCKIRILPAVRFLSHLV